MPKSGETKRICKRGHDTAVHGRNVQGHCYACKKGSNWKEQGIVNADGTPFEYVDYDRAYQSQQGRCKLCGVHQSEAGKVFDVDHHHDTNVFRSLLCHLCNMKVGWYEMLDGEFEKLKEYLG